MNVCEYFYITLRCLFNLSVWPLCSLRQVPPLQPTQPDGHPVAVAHRHLRALSSRSGGRRAQAPWSHHVRPPGGLRGVHVLAAGLQRSSAQPAQRPGGGAVCAGQGHAAEPAARPSQSRPGDAVSGVHGSAEDAASPAGASRSTSQKKHRIICARCYLFLRFAAQLHVSTPPCCDAWNLHDTLSLQQRIHFYFPSSSRSMKCVGVGGGGEKHVHTQT